MTERERIREDNSHQSARAYPTGTTATYGSPDVTVATPSDLVRWGPILAGLFAALATLATLGVLGLAIGLNSYDPGDPLGSFGIGAGIWSAISALIAFFVGGLIAGRTAAFRGRNSGILNGAMVWFVAIPLLLWGLLGGVGTLARAAGSAASTAAQTAGAAAGQVADDPGAAAGATGAAQDAAGNLQATATAVVGGIDSQDVENVTNRAGDTAWGTLLSLGLAAAAAIGGGYVGAQRAGRRAEFAR
jgi:hypothetical protein